MNKMTRFILAGLPALALAAGFNACFLGLLERPPLEQALLMFFLAGPLAFIFFSILNKRTALSGQRTAAPISWKFPFLDNLPGILLGLSFFGIYLAYGMQLKQISVAQVDNLFDADTASWMRRISAPDVKDFEMRGPHPFTYFIFRPFGWLLNLITNSPPLSAIILNTFAGGLCVFLAWLFVKHRFQNSTYAFLIAALLGLSTAHLVFGSVVETYIFSALSMILFYYLLQTNPSSTASVVFASVMTFGITLTNFIQNCVGYIVFRPRWRDIFRFIAWALSISIILSFLHTAVYPASKLFLLPSSVENEFKFFTGLSKLPTWRIIGRIIQLVRTFSLYTVIAPDVFVLRDEVGSYIPEFNFYKIVPGTFSHSGYDGLGQFLVIVWVAILLVAGSSVIWNLVRTRKADLPIAFALCIAFNFILHIDYGQELFLYSPDWAYAVIFFVAFGLAPVRENRFFQAGFLLFLILLAYNQWQFMQTIIEALKPFMSIGG